MDGRAARLGEVAVQQLPDGRRKVYGEEGWEFGRALDRTALLALLEGVDMVVKGRRRRCGRAA